MVVYWNEFAEEELKQAYNWQDLKRIGLGGALVLCIDAAVDGLLRHPYFGTPITDDVRRVLIKKFPYGLYYRVRDKRIEVVGFRHFRREPIYKIK